MPIPTSLSCSEPDYDDRLWRTLQLAFAGWQADVRCLLRQRCSTAPDHRAARRLPADALQGLISLDARSLAAAPLRAGIVLFDDLLTSGKHYRCCEGHLRAWFPGVPISGCFIARRALPTRWRWRAGYGN